MDEKYKLWQADQLKGRNIFVDTNVLIYLFWPTGEHAFEQKYATTFNQLRKQGNNLYVDFLIISEIINRALRIEYGKFLLTNTLTESQFKFKKFRDSEEGQSALEDIFTVVKDILQQLSVTGKVFSKAEIENSLFVDRLDFVDKAIASLCKDKEFVLFTNDKDFKDTGLEILTGNPHILH